MGNVEVDVCEIFVGKMGVGFLWLEFRGVVRVGDRNLRLFRRILRRILRRIEKSVEVWVLR